MKVIIDRFEGKMAVIELPDGKRVNVPKELFCGGREGDVFNISKDMEETVKRKERIAALSGALRQ